MKMPVVNMSKTGSNMKQLRVSKGMSVKEVSVFLGTVSAQAVYAWELGNTLPTVDHLLHLSKLYGITVEELVVTDWVEVHL